MIRKSYSLSTELRKSESKRQQNIQSRQKRQDMMSRLVDVDPVKLYYKLQGAKEHNKSRVKRLQADWDFMINHGLHKTKIERLLANIDRKEAEKHRRHGPKSVYYNPELNPLGLVPDINALPYSVKLENHTVPLDSKYLTVYKEDPIINKLGIKPPLDEQPRFYKRVNSLITVTHSTKGFEFGQT